MSRTLRLTDGVDEAIRAHGRETYPHECCGALVGRDSLVTSAVPLPNTTDEGPRRRFLVRPSDYQEAERAAVDAGVPRFIPSDFAIDFTKIPEGGNRNLDLRREFHRRLERRRGGLGRLLRDRGGGGRAERVQAQRPRRRIGERADLHG